jgi:hypothetical protein
MTKHAWAIGPHHARKPSSGDSLSISAIRARHRQVRSFCRKHAVRPNLPHVLGCRAPVRQRTSSGRPCTVELRQKAREVCVARWYDPGNGQFLSVDPDLAETDQPYAYASDDPVNESDPSGQTPLNPCNWFGVCHKLHEQVDAIGAVLSGKDVELYEQYSADIHESAAEFGLDPVLLATIIQLEGAGMETWKEAFYLGIGPPAETGFDLVRKDPGIGNTRPSNVQQVYETCFPGTAVPSQAKIRLWLSTSASYGIWAAGGYLALLRYDFSEAGYGYLSDRDDAISYEVGGTSDWPYLTSHNWEGQSATPRGRAYDFVSKIIATPLRRQARKGTV